MKRPLIFLAALALTLLAYIPARGQEDEYLHIYNLIQSADSLDSAGQPGPALEKYIQAQTQLQTLKQMYPGWNDDVVRYRLDYLAQKIAEVSKETPVRTPAPALPAGTNAASPGPVSAPAPGAAVTAQLQQLQNEVRQLRTEKLELESRLKEALSAQPAVADPRQLVKAEARITELLKANSLLQVTLQQQQKKKVSEQSPPANNAADLAQLKQSLADATRKAAAASTRAKELALENQSLQNNLRRSIPPAANPANLEARQTALAQANQKLAAQTALAAKLAQENTELQARVQSLHTNAATLAALRSENGMLRQRLAAAKALPATASGLDKLSRQLAAARAKIVALQTNAERLRSVEVQLAVLEAPAVPFTKEELALFKTSKPTLAPSAPAPTRSAVLELPAGAATLAAEARRDFAAGRVAQAADKYERIVRQNQNNVYALANLAAIQLQLGDLAAARQHIDKALALAPEDSYSLLILGQLQFRRAQYDAALATLSRAAKLDPKNPEIQDYLGLTLSEKGLRGPAESALRRAIELDPNDGKANNNLAVMYLTDKPPLVALARWHYEKALAAGFPPNPELDKMLKQAEAKEAAQAKR